MALIKRVLVYRLGSLGDMLVAIPALRIVRNAHPSAEITLLTNFPVSGKASAAASVLEGTGLVNAYLEYPARTRNPALVLRLIRRLRAEKFDRFISLASTRSKWDRWRDRVFLRLAGIRDFIGFSRTEAAPHYRLRDGSVEHEADMLMRRVARWCPAGSRLNFDLELTEAEKSRAAQWFAATGMRTPFIAISVGTKLEIKDWGQTNWSAMLSRVSGVVGPMCGLVAIGSADEEARAQECFSCWNGSTASFCGRLTPRESAAVLSSAHLFVGHDSGPMHLAAAVGVPCVAIYCGRAPPGKWFPLGGQHTVFYKRTSCNSCGLDVCITERKRCILGITPEEVAEAVHATYRRRTMVTAHV